MLQHYSRYRCSTLTPKVLRGIRRSTPCRSITASVFPDLDRDATPKEAPPVELQPELVPAIRDALFDKEFLRKRRPFNASHGKTTDRLKTVESRQDFLRLIQECVVNHKDGLQLCSISPDLVRALMRHWDQCTVVEALHDANAITARLKHVGAPLPRELLRLFVIEAARRNSPAVVMGYISMVKSRNNGNDGNQGNQPRWLPVTKLLIEFLKLGLHRQASQGWNGGRKKKEWRHVIQFLLSEWDQMEEPVGGSIDAHVNQISNVNFNKFIQAFLSLGDVELAWQVARKYEHRFGPLGKETWKLLLDHPDYIRDWSPALVHHYEQQLKDLQRGTFGLLFAHPDLVTKWTPDLNEPVKMELERRLNQIESLMQIKWKGGENGYHELE